MHFYNETHYVLDLTPCLNRIKLAEVTLLSFAKPKTLIIAAHGHLLRAKRVEPANCHL